jgi:hypothetical protein
METLQTNLNIFVCKYGVKYFEYISQRNTLDTHNRIKPKYAYHVL